MATNSKSYDDKLNAIVANFNRKLSRLEKLGYNNLPSRVSAAGLRRELKTGYTDKRAVNAFLRDLQRFNKKAATTVINVDGKEYTQYDVDIFKRKLRRERARVDREIESAQSMPTKYPMQHDVYKANLQAKRAALSGSWINLINSRISEELDKQYAQKETYDNYLNTLFVDAYQIGFEDDKIEYVKNRLLSLKPRQFLRALEDDPNIQYIFDYYHSLTRTSYNGVDDGRAYEAFQELYENIDAIIDKYR